MDGVGIFPPPGRGCLNEVKAGANGIHCPPDITKLSNHFDTASANVILTVLPIISS